MKLENHPFSILERISEKVPEDSRFEFSIYEYEPQSILDNRTTFHFLANQINHHLLRRMIDNLGPEEELAIHSKVTIDKKVFHIPMIDFSCKIENLIENKKLVKSIIPKNIHTDIAIYDSGNSLHGYGMQLIKNRDWLNYLGRLLLLNLPNRSALIDTRWIGHRLMAGYCSLRLSNNTKHYLKEPVFVEQLYKL